MDFMDSYSRVYKHLDITRMQNFMALLGDPQKDLKFVHVAGTNGKGSCSAMTASILTHSGYVTGLFTSPHIISFNERFQVDGELIADDELAEIIGEVKKVNDTLDEDRQINWFEFVTAVAMVYFKRRRCDMVVLEVGVGGEFDGTNVIDVPECAVIMNIGLDHTAQLGNTLEEIASAKAGIIKAGGDVVIYRGSESVEKVFEDKCAEVGACLHKADFSSIRSISSGLEGQVFNACGYNGLRIPLAGDHQLRNAATVLTVILVLQGKGWNITEKNIREGLAETSWPVRFQIVRKDPVFIIDGGHNPQCIEAVQEGLKKLVEPGRNIIFMTGILKDKDTSTMVHLLSSLSKDFVAVTPDSHRAMPAEELAELFGREGASAEVFDSIEDGIERAIEKAGKDGVVCCVGSLYLAGDVLSYFKNKTE